MTDHDNPYEATASSEPRSAHCKKGRVRNIVFATFFLFVGVAFMGLIFLCFYVCLDFQAVQVHGFWGALLKSINDPISMSILVVLAFFFGIAIMSVWAGIVRFRKAVSRSGYLLRP